MTPADVEIAQAFADVATIATLQHRAKLEAQTIHEQLTHALNSRVVIEQAKGMIVESLDLDIEDSFNVLRNHARNHDLRLADLAEAVLSGAVAASALDPPPAR